MKLGDITLSGQLYKDCEIVLQEFVYGGIALKLTHRAQGDKQPLARVNSWLEGLSADEVAVKDYSENAGMLGAMLRLGVLEAPHRHVRSGFVEFPICRLTERGQSLLNDQEA